MTIESMENGGCVTWICDFCPNVAEYEGETFMDALALAKTDGWRAIKDGDLWIHKCPACCEGDT